ncbi:MAG: hypothetical protein ABL983_25250, partial [Nitrospira sp.]
MHSYWSLDFSVRRYGAVHYGLLYSAWRYGQFGSVIFAHTGPSMDQEQKQAPAPIDCPLSVAPYR